MRVSSPTLVIGVMDFGVSQICVESGKRLRPIKLGSRSQSSRVPLTPLSAVQKILCEVLILSVPPGRHVSNGGLLGADCIGSSSVHGMLRFVMSPVVEHRRVLQPFRKWARRQSVS